VEKSVFLGANLLLYLRSIRFSVLVCRAHPRSPAFLNGMLIMRAKIYNMKIWFIEKYKLRKILKKTRDELLKTGCYYILPEEPGNTKPNYSHINNGFCGLFADTIKDKFPEVNIYTESMLDKKELPPHYFLEYRGMYYDAECINGVGYPVDLPLFCR